MTDQTNDRTELNSLVIELKSRLTRLSELSCAQREAAVDPDALDVILSEREALLDGVDAMSARIERIVSDRGAFGFEAVIVELASLAAKVIEQDTKDMVAFREACQAVGGEIRRLSVGGRATDAYAGGGNDTPPTMQDREA
jgi:hypothetical protein